jgi:hypothetical protein
MGIEDEIEELKQRVGEEGACGIEKRNRNDRI